MSYADQVKAQIAALLAACPEITEDDDLLRDMLEGETDILKLMRYLVVQHADDMMIVNAIKVRKADLDVRKGRMEVRMERLRETMSQLLALLPEDKRTIRTAEATVSYRAPMQKVEVDDIEALPQGFFKVTKEAKKTELARALKAGETVPGARLVDGEPGVTIRVK